MSPSLPISASFPYCTGTIPHHCVTPHASLARQPLEALDLLLASVALLGVAVPAHPVVRWNLNEGNGCPHERRSDKGHNEIWKRVIVNVVMETLAYPRFLFRLDVRPGAGRRIPVCAAAVDRVFAACAQNSHGVALWFYPLTLGGVDGETGGVTPPRICAVLTGAAQSLLPQAQQHALANVTVDGLVEMFHSPKVLAICLDHLVGRGAMKKTRVREDCLCNCANSRECLSNKSLYFALDRCFMLLFPQMHYTRRGSMV